MYIYICIEIRLDQIRLIYILDDILDQIDYTYIYIYILDGWHSNVDFRVENPRWIHWSLGGVAKTRFEPGESVDLTAGKRGFLRVTLW